MEIKDLAEKYNLDPKTDFWKHKQSGKWIITHDACEKIASMENIILAKWETLNSERDFCRFLITMAMPMQDTAERLITSIGEASKENCQSKYYGSMAEKRGVDRCILKLINAYEYGIYSDSEADSFKKPVIANDPYAKHRGVEHEVLLSKAQGKKIIILETELTGQIKHPIDFTNLTSADAEAYIVKLEGMTNELSEV